MKKIVLPLVIAIAMIAVGCSKPPESEKKEAESAMNAAMSAGADKYASADFMKAQNLFRDALMKMASKDYGDAKKLYSEAKPLFEKATAQAAEGKKAMIEENVKSMKDVEKGWKELQGKVAKNKKIKPFMNNEWKGDSKMVSDNLRTAKDTNNTDPYNAKLMLTNITNTIAKWDTYLKGNK
jgi:hypothetical protein